MITRYGRPISWVEAINESIAPIDYNSGAIETLQMQVRGLIEILASICNSLPADQQRELIEREFYSYEWEENE